jgi:hypothetical protein
VSIDARRLPPDVFLPPGASVQEPDAAIVRRESQSSGTGCAMGLKDHRDPAAEVAGIRERVLRRHGTFSMHNWLRAKASVSGVQRPDRVYQGLQTAA